ncbi:MAG: CoA transferase [Dehalococcoidia bacterium]|jgi:benzylsuccinate CoA-transferase BbsE subunit|nr:CoA transferase [Dehalococcoidia bacterium]
MAMALEGVRIIDASGPIGHYAGRLLADLGADVIKVEPPEGDPARQWAPFLPEVDAPESALQFLLLNANKRGVTLDLDTPRGRELYLELVKTADVVMDSLSPDEAARLKLTTDDLTAAKADIIHTSVTGWGLTGPRANWAYSDIVGCAMSGAMTLAGTSEGPPEQLPDMQGYHCASIDAAAGTMGALVYHQSTGVGQRVEVSMQEALSIAQETAMMQADILGTNRERGVPMRGFTIPGTGLYDTADGHVYMMASGIAGAGFVGLVSFMDETGDAQDLTEEPYPTFIREKMNTNFIMSLMSDPEQAGAALEVLQHLDEVVRAFCAKHPKLYLYEEGQQRRILVGMVNTPQDILASPQLEARDWFVNLDDPGRGVTLRYPGPQWQLQGTPAELRRAAPLLGEHNNEIFSELGVDAGELAELAAGGVRS